MSAPIVEVGTFTSPITVPTAGELLTAATTLAPLQILANRTKYLNSFPIIRSINRAQGTGTLTAYATLNTVAVTDIGGITVSVPATSTDILIAVAQSQLAATGLTVGRLQLVHNSASFPGNNQLGACNGEVTLPATYRGVMTLFGYAVAGFSETYTVQLRGFDELGTGLTIQNNWSLSVFCIKV
jgi:hypothetical protein